LKSYID